MYDSSPTSLLLICIFPYISNLNLVLLGMPMTKLLSLKLSERKTSLQSKNKPMQIKLLCDLNNEGDVAHKVTFLEACYRCLLIYGF